MRRQQIPDPRQRAQRRRRGRCPGSGFRRAVRRGRDPRRCRGRAHWRAATTDRGVRHNPDRGARRSDGRAPARTAPPRSASCASGRAGAASPGSAAGRARHSGRDTGPYGRSSGRARGPTPAKTCPADSVIRCRNASCRSIGVPGGSAARWRAISSASSISIGPSGSSARWSRVGLISRRCRRHGIALGVQHAAAGGELEHAADPGQARIIVVIVLQDPADAVGIADDKNALTEQAALDEQLVEQLLVAGRERILLRDAQQPQRRQPPRRARRHRGQWRGSRRLRIGGGHPDVGSPLRRAGPPYRTRRVRANTAARGVQFECNRRDCHSGVAPAAAPLRCPIGARQHSPSGSSRGSRRHGQKDRDRRRRRGRRLYRGASGQGRRGRDLYRFLARARRNDETGRADDHASPGRGTVHGHGRAPCT